MGPLLPCALYYIPGHRKFGNDWWGVELHRRKSQLKKTEIHGTKHGELHWIYGRSCWFTTPLTLRFMVNIYVSWVNIDKQWQTHIFWASLFRSFGFYFWWEQKYNHTTKEKSHSTKQRTIVQKCPEMCCLHLGNLNLDSCSINLTTTTTSMSLHFTSSS